MLLKDKILCQILDFLKEENLSTANVCFFMQQIRLLLEINENQNKYKISNHYCNWLLHKNLNRSNSPKIIDEISKSFQNFKTKNELVLNISEALSLQKLVSELQEILWINIQDKKALANSLVGNEDYWVHFLSKVLNQILHRPLLLKNSNKNIDGFEFRIYGIQIAEGKNNNFCIEMLSNELESKNKRILSEIVLYKKIKNENLI